MPAQFDDVVRRRIQRSTKGNSSSTSRRNDVFFGEIARSACLRRPRRSVLSRPAAPTSTRSRDDHREITFGVERDLDVVLGWSIGHEPHGLPGGLDLEAVSLTVERLDIL